MQAAAGAMVIPMEPISERPAGASISVDRLGAACYRAAAAATLDSHERANSHTEIRHTALAAEDRGSGLRASEGPFGLFAAGRGAAHRQAGQAVPGAWVPCSGAYGYEQSVRCPRIFGQAEQLRHPADRGRLSRHRLRGK